MGTTEAGAKADKIKVGYLVDPQPPSTRRGPASEADLKWQRQKMVRWFSPGQLAVTGLRAVVSATFGAYADRREMQAALHEIDESPPGSAAADHLIYRYDKEEEAGAEFWIDFVADLGDGFDPTYTIAWLLAQPTLPLPAPDGATIGVARVASGTGPQTRRADILVMGGDQVYPTASRDEYSNRLAGPYEAALPWLEGRVPSLFAIPGNHDWYDGLTSFIRQFCQQRWIGGWKTQQHRSYFAVQLPRRWWLLGIDVQLESDIDQPQVDYFCRVAREHMRPGDRVILCTAEPAWVHTPSEPEAFDNLAFFEKVVLAPQGAELALTLTGDLHHYSRYSSIGREGAKKHHKITAGGGGAYLLGTQILAKTIELTPPHPQPEGPAARVETGAKEQYTQEAAYPSPSKSVTLKLGAVTLPLKNPSFVVFLGLVYTLFAWFLQSASRSLTTAGGSFMDTAGASGWAQGAAVWDSFVATAVHAPTVTGFTLTFILAFIGFCKPDVERSRLLRNSRRLQMLVKVLVGGLHGFAHVALLTGLIWMFVRVNVNSFGLEIDSAPQVIAFFVEMMLVGGPLGAFLVGLFLLPFVNYNEAFSAMRLEGFKNFVRMRIAADGTLTVYPYGVEKPARWRFRPNADPGAPYFEPESPPEVKLIDGPIELAAPVPRRVQASS